MYQSPAQKVRAALKTLASNPTLTRSVQDTQTTAEREAAAKAASEAKRVSAARARVSAAMAERVEHLIADYVAREQDALRLAAESVARTQLDAEHGLTPPESLGMFPVPQRIGPSQLDKFRKALHGSSPLPWDKRGRTASQVQSDQVREASKVLGTDDVAALALQKRQEHDQRRQAADAARRAANVERKRQAGIIA